VGDRLGAIDGFGFGWQFINCSVLRNLAWVCWEFWVAVGGCRRWSTGNFG
jgi:hypothetical protein